MKAQIKEKLESGKCGTAFVPVYSAPINECLDLGDAIPLCGEED
jgi:hypothetical protein